MIAWRYGISLFVYNLSWTLKRKFHILASPCIVLSKYNNVASHISKIALLILTCNIKYIILYSIAIKFRLKWTHPDLILGLFSTGMSSNPISGYLSKYIFIPWGLCFLRKILETILNKKNNQIERFVHERCGNGYHCLGG